MFSEAGTSCAGAVSSMLSFKSQGWYVSGRTNAKHINGN